MTANQFRKIALSMPEAVESAHMNHPDFRVRKKIFATLGPAEAWGMVSLTPEQQNNYVRAYPTMFTPVKGGWGLRGATTVHLKAATAERVRQAMKEAWSNIAPSELIKQA